MKENINHPHYYGGIENPYEAIKVIEAWELGFNLGNVVKYVSRAGKKDLEREVEDLEKALWYLTREVENRREVQRGMKEKAAIPKETDPINEVLDYLGYFNPASRTETTKP